jgi:hypothetical protein
MKKNKLLVLVMESSAEDCVTCHCEPPRGEVNLIKKLPLRATGGRLAIRRCELSVAI